MNLAIRKRSILNEENNEENLEKKIRMEEDQSILQDVSTPIRNCILTLSADSIDSIRMANNAHAGVLHQCAGPSSLPRMETLTITFCKPPSLDLRVEIRIQEEFLPFFTRLHSIMSEAKEKGIIVTKKKERSRGLKTVLITFELSHYSPLFTQLGSALSSKVGAVRMAFLSQLFTKKAPSPDLSQLHPWKWGEREIEKEVDEKKEEERKEERKSVELDENPNVLTSRSGKRRSAIPVVTATSKIDCEAIEPHETHVPIKKKKTEEKGRSISAIIYTPLPYCTDFDNLLKNIEEIGTISVEISDMCSKIGDLILMLVSKCEVKKVRLAVKRSMMNTRPSDFLFDLSSLVESIELVQPTVIKENAVRIPSTANYFFGLHDEEWEWTIMEMYMRGVKRITMENRNYSHFTNEQVASVCEDIASHNLEVFFRSTFKGEIVPFDAKGYVTSSKEPPESDVESLRAKVQNLEMENRRLKERAISYESSTVVNEKIEIDLPQLSEGKTIYTNEPLFVKCIDMGERVTLQISGNVEKESDKFKSSEIFEIKLSFELHSRDEIAATLLLKMSDYREMADEFNSCDFLCVDKESSKGVGYIVPVQQTEGYLAGLKIEVKMIRQAKANSIYCDNNAIGTVEIEHEKILVDIPYISKWSHFLPVFFNSEMMEKSSGVYEIKDCSAADFRIMLNVIYPSSRPIDESIVEKMLELADRFIMPMLKRKCEIFLSGCRRITRIQKLEWADRFNLASTREIVLSSVNSVEIIITRIINTKKYENLSKEMKRAIESRYVQLNIRERDCY
ncbi:hypothetical protein PRIPAC_72051 [Pristionchus pacificus]|uniref:BTB domain-containing protein n=1 Tax=Pristionchus pacificus TaxID=54126 RepID=A0A2A6BFQ9_PRIPA|nr:hypothetical protein PRIPAC_72051 [Pristionchus pacificus]|eukprot:PDM64720.1 BTB domain-containing protein [Pristionchus pacificus]